MDTLEILYQKFVNTLTYALVHQRILPMSGFFDVFNRILEAVHIDSRQFQRDWTGLIFEPNIHQIIDFIAKTFPKIRITSGPR